MANPKRIISSVLRLERRDLAAPLLIILLVGAVLALPVLASCSSSPATSTTPSASKPPGTPSTSAPPAATSPAPTPTPAASSTASATPPTSPHSSAGAVTITLTARNISFDRDSISVPAGANVTLILNNQDNLNHNVSVYQNLTGGQTRPVFVGGIVAGPGTITYQFAAPTSPGSYFFECDVHPMMNGSFVIIP